MSQQLSISSAFSMLAMAFLCLVAAANSALDRPSLGGGSWVKMQAEQILPS
jgi:hypothetical protein